LIIKQSISFYLTIFVHPLINHPPGFSITLDFYKITLRIFSFSELYQYFSSIHFGIHFNDTRNYGDNNFSNQAEPFIFFNSYHLTIVCQLNHKMAYLIKRLAIC